MTSPAQLIADNLSSLPHPDGTCRQMPGFNTQLLPQVFQEQIKKTSLELGECIIHLLTTSGYRVVTEAEYQTPRDETPPQTGNLHCSQCDTRLLSISLVNPDKILTNGKSLLTQMAKRNPECPHDA